MSRVPAFKNCVFCPCSFSVGDQYQHCLGEAPISAKCSIFHFSHPSELMEQDQELKLRKQLMKKTVEAPIRSGPPYISLEKWTAPLKARSWEQRLILLSLKRRLCRAIRGTLIDIRTNYLCVRHSPKEGKSQHTRVLKCKAD